MKRRASLAVGLVAFTAAAWAAIVESMDGAPRPGSISIVEQPVSASQSSPAMFSAESTAATLTTNRSALYPATWRPLDINNGTFQSTVDGPQFLHDFSYAGYGRGGIDGPIPTRVGFVNLAVPAPTGDASIDTPAIQSRIDQACSAGGGVVNLAAGTYAIRPQSTNTHSLLIHCSNLILRGQGKGATAGEAGKTFLYNDQQNMAAKVVITVRPNDGYSTANTAWYDDIAGPGVAYFADDTTGPTRVVRLATSPAAAGLTVGSKFVLRNDMTSAFRNEHGMGGKWFADDVRGLLYHRKIVAINETEKTVTFDTPLRYPMKTRDNARVYKTSPNIYNVGIEKLSVGMRQSDANTSAEMNNAVVIKINRVEGGWITNVASYRPPQNTRDVHMLSQGINLARSTRMVTVSDVSMEKPQFEGGGGNGYLFAISGMDHLLKDTFANDGRHNYLLQEMTSHGNVLLRCHSKNGLAASETHRGLSHANLFDSCTLDNDYLTSLNREGASSGAGLTGSEIVFWNTRAISEPTRNVYKPAIIISAQYKWGYIIGTSGPYSTVFTPSAGLLANGGSAEQSAPADYTELVGNGETLEPQSLFIDQVARRQARGSCITCP